MSYRVSDPWSGIYWVYNWNNKPVAKLEWVDKDTYELLITDYIPTSDENDFYMAIKEWANKNSYTVKHRCSTWIEPEYVEETRPNPDYEPGYDMPWDRTETVKVLKNGTGCYESHYKDL